MAKDQHLQIMKKGVDAWNAWRRKKIVVRPDLTGAKLTRADLYGVNLFRTDLTRADLRGAKLTRATLSGACLLGANLFGADLRGADLRGTILTRANLYGADLREANVEEARLYNTIFVDTDLAGATGLDMCTHTGPSTLNHRTLAKSGPLPVVFLQGCGLPDWLIEAYKLTKNSLSASQVTNISYRIIELRSDPAIQFHSCFISYSHKNKSFAQRLHDDLQKNGVRCWFAPEDLKIGSRIRPAIHDAIRLHDKLLLILSEHSVGSQWVEDEVELALDREHTEDSTILFPIRLDDSVLDIDKGWASTIKRTRHIGDFCKWNDDAAYQLAFERLLRDLKATG